MKLRNLIPIIPLAIIGLFISSIFQDSSANEEPLLSELSHYEYVTFSAG